MSNRNNNSDTSQILNESLPSPCDLNLVIYFLVSCLLFSIGFKITFFTPIEDEDLNSPTRYWLGPLFLLSGIIIATFALIYIRSKNLLQLMNRDGDLFGEVSEHVQVASNSNTSYQNLPPSYTYATSTTENYMSTNYGPPFNEADFMAVTSLNSNQSHYDRTRTNLNLNAQSTERNNSLINSTLITKDLPPAYSDIIK